MKILIAGLMLSVIFSFATVDAAPDGDETYSNPDYGITLHFPENWYIDERPETIAVPCVIEASPVDGEPADRDPFGAFIMPILIGEGYFDNASDLADVWINTVSTDWVDFTEGLRRDVTTSQGYAAVEVAYYGDDEDDNRIYWLVWLVVTDKASKAWVLGYCARDDFKSYEDAAISILESAEFEDF